MSETEGIRRDSGLQYYLEEFFGKKKDLRTMGGSQKEGKELEGGTFRNIKRGLHKTRARRGGGGGREVHEKVREEDIVELGVDCCLPRNPCGRLGGWGNSRKGGRSVKKKSAKEGEAKMIGGGSRRLGRRRGMERERSRSSPPEGGGKRGSEGTRISVRLGSTRERDMAGKKGGGRSSPL